MFKTPRRADEPSSVQSKSSFPDRPVIIKTVGHLQRSEPLVFVRCAFKCSFAESLCVLGHMAQITEHTAVCACENQPSALLHTDLHPRTEWEVSLSSSSCNYRISICEITGNDNTWVSQKPF